MSNKKSGYHRRESVVRQEISPFEAERIVKALYERHGQFLKDDETFEVSGYRSKTDAYAKIVLKNEDESFYYPVECRVDLSVNALPGPVAAQELVLDFLDYYFGRYLREERELFVPIDWAEVKFDDYKVQIRGQIFNLQLERLADLLLSGEATSEEVEEKLKAMKNKKNNK